MKDLKIRLEHWDYECADSCCYDCGINIFLNDEKVVDENGNAANGEFVESSLVLVLTKLGYNVTIEE